MFKFLAGGGIILGIFITYIIMERFAQQDSEVDKIKTEMEIQHKEFQASLNKDLSNFYSDKQELKDFYENKSKKFEEEAKKDKESLEETEKLIKESRERQKKFSDELHKDLSENLTEEQKKSNEALIF